MKVLVTGASGFVGSSLVKELCTDFQTVGATRQSKPNFPNNVEHRRAPELDESSGWQGLLSDVDVIVHLAARVHIMDDNASDPLAAFREANVEGTRRLAESAVAQGVRRFIFLSSVKVYGERTEGVPFTSDSPAKPVDPYGQSKYEAEQELLKVGRRHGLEVVILRPPVIYGPGVRGNVRRLGHLVRTGLPLPFSAISNRRTMLSIGNLMHWIREAVTADPVPARPVVVSDLDSLSTSHMARLLSKGMGRRSYQFPMPVKFLRLGAGLVKQRAAIDRLTEDLVVTPTIDAFPGIETKLEPSVDAVVRLGGSFRRYGKSTT